MDFSGAKNRQEHRHRLAFTLYGHALIVLDFPWPHSLPLYALCFVFSIVLPKAFHPRCSLSAWSGGILRPHSQYSRAHGR
jgi:hypothetical protein